ncbi:hypothetical protein PAXINDRAFT_103501 [Paxillus involutus ATCC 200175]|uniref:Uncharacterized protein n=1 Tax=Paxillus involutus ATCC 200175 TaxID=664439 RepID=A0A0C9T3W1_PAXIN|nr:hypothetical protein PAXINDRAFT_103501 [Paxillus involutus ATCC 200175]
MSYKIIMVHFVFTLSLFALLASNLVVALPAAAATPETVDSSTPSGYCIGPYEVSPDCVE